MLCVIIDDEPQAIKILERYATMADYLTVQKTFVDAVEAFHFINNHEVDLVFIDINMPDLTGIQFMQASKSTALFIITTAYSEYAVKSYELDVIDYLLKPIELDRFLVAVDKAQQKLKSVPPTQTVAQAPEKKNDFIVFESRKQIYKFTLSDILFLVSKDNYIEIHTHKSKTLIRLTLKEAELKLPTIDFIRVHRSFIVAYRHIDTIERHSLVMGKKRIPVSETYESDFSKFVKNKTGCSVVEK